MKKKPKNFKIGDLVWLFTPTVVPGDTKKLSKQNNSPFTIIEKLNEVNYKIVLVANLKNFQVVHIDRLSLFKNRLPVWSNDRNKHPSTPITGLLAEYTLRPLKTGVLQKKKKITVSIMH